MINPALERAGAFVDRERIERFVLTAARAALGLGHCWHYHHVAGGEPCGAEAARILVEARLSNVVTARRPQLSYKGRLKKT